MNSEKLNYYQSRSARRRSSSEAKPRSNIARASGGRCARSRERRLEDDLEQLGWRLYEELFPDELKAEYAESRDQVETLQITSAEPWIPVGDGASL